MPSRANNERAARDGMYKWLSLVAAIWLQSITGTNTNFPAYSSHLKQVMSISQVQLNNLAFANDAGKLFGWLSGIAALYLPLWVQRQGNWSSSPQRDRQATKVKVRSQSQVGDSGKEGRNGGMR
ncbi:hypothetical protein CRG98_021599 [Punica granatum]|uniref:Nodulin-like domain-containing protein n=1 Tax=Punica granatum TaxID=22663 RepID=A0A2I0JP17_PUNGR|nr:hypothetical protein CRG98_021599 [Punica granatum]